MIQHNLSTHIKMITLTVILTPLYATAIILIASIVLTATTLATVYMILTAPMKSYNIIRNSVEDRIKLTNYRQNYTSSNQCKPHQPTDCDDKW